jgi:membrane protein implicated in regulation of membrane protease activity
MAMTQLEVALEVTFAIFVISTLIVFMLARKYCRRWQTDKLRPMKWGVSK